MKIATCIADLEDYICEQAKTRPLVAGETIAQWKTGEPVTILGQWRGKGYFAPLCVRWIAAGSRGMFAKGLAGYIGEELTAEQIGHLPMVK
jgi:hypothetical protein